MFAARIHAFCWIATAASLSCSSNTPPTAAGGQGGTPGSGGSGAGGTMSIGGRGGEPGVTTLYNCDPPIGTLTTIATQTVASGLLDPVSLNAAPGDNDRLFVLEKAGRIRVIENGMLLDRPFLDLSHFVWSTGEAGLLALAFHPDYQRNRRFFVYYLRFTENGAHVVEFRRSQDDPNVAEPIQAHDDPLLELQFGGVHLGGSLEFGPLDGYLYLSQGERGNVPASAQDLDSLLGKILRLDVSGSRYAIPPGNLPGGRPEVWAYGLRNPWRMTFDACIGDLYIGDVGALDREEIDFAPARMGHQNYGWPVMEGTICYPPGTMSCDGGGLTMPIIDHTHAAPDYMHAIIGGYVYRGSAIPELRGMYVYGATGGVHGLRHDGAGNVSEWKNFTPDVDITMPVSFGQDNYGELYIVDHQPVGRIQKIVPAR